MSESESKVITITGGRRKRVSAGEFVDRLRAFDGVTVAVNGSSPVAKPVPAPKPTKPARTRWHGKTVDLAQKVANLYKTQTSEQRIKQFGKASGRKESSLKKAFEWACKVYERPDGSSYTPALLASSLSRRG